MENLLFKFDENVTELINGGLGQQGREDRHTAALINIYCQGWCL
jgi:hypothetical protein